MLDLLISLLTWGVVGFILLTILNKSLRATFFKPWKETKLSSMLNLDKIIGEDGHILLDRDGKCHMIIEIHGQDFAALSNEDREKKLFGRESWVKRMAELQFDFKVVSHKTEDTPKPLNKQDQKHLARADNTWEAQFERAYHMRHFIYLTAKDKTNIKALENAAEETLSLLSDYRCSILGRVNRYENSLLTFLSDLANPLWPSPIGDIREDIAKHIVGSNFVQRKDGVMEFRRGPEKVFAACVGFWRWSTELDDKMFSEILAQDVPMTILHLVKTFDVSDGKAVIDGYDRTVEFSEATKIQIEVAKQWVTPGAEEEHNVCEHHVSILVYSEDEDQLAKNIREVMAPLTQYGVRPVTEGPVSAAAFFSLFPGRSHPFRPQTMFSHNIAAMAAFEGKETGLSRSVFGDGPIQRFKPVGGSGTINFQFHNSENPKAVGHTTLIGRTRGGKTTLLTFLLKGILRFKSPRILAFDRRKGMYVFTKFAHGTYVTLDRSRGFNPLQQKLTPTNKQRIRSWVRMLGGNLYSPETDAILQRFVKDLEETPFEHRKLSNFWDTHFKGSAIGKYLDKFINDPEFNWLFNADTCVLQDTLRKNRLVVVDTQEFLDNPEIAGPFLSYAMNAVEEINASDQVPFVFACDETAGACRNEGFLSRMKEVVFEWGKLGGVAIFAFQTDQTIRELGLENLLKEQMATLIFWRNSRLNEESARSYGLEDPEINFLNYNANKQAGDYAVLVKQEKLSTAIQGDLSVLGDDLYMFNSDADAAAKLIELENDPSVADPLQAYLNLKGKFKNAA